MVRGGREEKRKEKGKKKKRKRKERNLIGPLLSNTLKRSHKRIPFQSQCPQFPQTTKLKRKVPQLVVKKVEGFQLKEDKRRKMKEVRKMKRGMGDTESMS